MIHSESISELATALSLAQSEIRGAKKDVENPAFKQGQKVSKYADLSSVWEACREPLTRNGLSITQIPFETPEGLMLVTMLMHKSGEWIKSTMAIKPLSTTPQAAGSAMTYARRYSLSAMVGVAPDDDDDGNAASQGKPYETRKTESPPLPTHEEVEANRAKIINEILETKSLDDLSKYMDNHKRDINALPVGYKAEAINAATVHKKTLSEVGDELPKFIDKAANERMAG
jgi:hypothetical protein